MAWFLWIHIMQCWNWIISKQWNNTLCDNKQLRSTGRLADFTHGVIIGQVWSWKNTLIIDWYKITMKHNKARIMCIFIVVCCMSKLSVQPSEFKVCVPVFEVKKVCRYYVPINIYENITFIFVFWHISLLMSGQFIHTVTVCNYALLPCLQSTGLHYMYLKYHESFDSSHNEIVI